MAKFWKVYDFPTSGEWYFNKKPTKKIIKKLIHTELNKEEFEDFYENIEIYPIVTED